MPTFQTASIAPDVTQSRDLNQGGLPKGPELDAGFERAGAEDSVILGAGSSRSGVTVLSRSSEPGVEVDPSPGSYQDRTGPEAYGPITGGGLYYLSAPEVLPRSGPGDADGPIAWQASRTNVNTFATGTEVSGPGEDSIRGVRILRVDGAVEFRPLKAA